MDNPSTPLADYFWIAGIEDVTYQDAPAPTAAAPVDETIVEDGEGNALDGLPSSTARARARHSRQNSANRLSKLSTDGRLSIHTLEDRDGTTRSNRSSATIRPVQDPGATPEFDFDRALMKFAMERENFLDDISFSAGAKLQARQPMVAPRTERIKADSSDLSGRRSPLRGIKGSIRRKMSFRDMSSMRKQPVAPRAGMCGPVLSHPAGSPAPARRLRSRLTHVYPSVRTDGEATEQLQLGDPAPRAARHRPGHAPIEAPLRARSS